MELKEHVALAPYTTLGVGGCARWFTTVASEADAVDAFRFARERGLPVFVLGGGSNLLVSDRGFDGLVVHVSIRGMAERALPGGQVLLQVGAGESWDEMVQHTVEQDLAGMECLAGIPGTVGGTPIQNVGAYGQEVGETITTLRCIDMHTLQAVELSNEECGFAYRTSLLNGTEHGRYLVTRVDFALTPGGTPKLEYAELRKRFAGQPSPSLVQVADAVREIRRGKGMVVDPAEPNSRSAGSFFRNPIVPSSVLERIASTLGLQPGEIPHWPAAEGRVKLPAAWLLERAGFVRGYALGQAGISARHTLALINRGGATATNVVVLRDRIVQTVQDRFGIRLEQEPVCVGEFAPPAEQGVKELPQQGHA